MTTLALTTLCHGDAPMTKRTPHLSDYKAP